MARVPPKKFLHFGTTSRLRDAAFYLALLGGLALPLPFDLACLALALGLFLVAAIQHFHLRKHLRQATPEDSQ